MQGFAPPPGGFPAPGFAPQSEGFPAPGFAPPSGGFPAPGAMTAQKTERELYKLVCIFIVGIADFGEGFLQFFFVRARILAKCGKGRVKIPQFHVHEAQKHKRVFRQLHGIYLFDFRLLYHSLRQSANAFSFAALFLLTDARR